MFQDSHYGKLQLWLALEDGPFIEEIYICRGNWHQWRKQLATEYAFLTTHLSLRKKKNPTARKGWVLLPDPNKRCHSCLQSRAIYIPNMTSLACSVSLPSTLQNLLLDSNPQKPTCYLAQNVLQLPCLVGVSSFVAPVYMDIFICLLLCLLHINLHIANLLK